MHRFASVPALFLAAIAAAGGCAHHPVRPTTCLTPGELPTTPRLNAIPDVSALAVHANRHPTRPSQYRKLTTYECRYLAVKNAPLADDLDRHPGNQSPNHPHLHPLKPSPREADVGRRVRGYLADEFRNKAAAEALEQFYQLAQAEGQFDLLAKALAELQARLAEAIEAEKRGLADHAGIDALRVQVLDFEARIAQLEAGLGSLNAGLRARLALDPADPMPLWPADPLRVKPSEIELAEALRTGLAYRPDLNLLRALLADDGQATDDLIQGLLKQISPLLAAMSSNPIVGLLTPHKSKRGETLRKGLQAMLAGRERQAEAEIRVGVATLRGNRLAAAAKAAEVQHLQGKLQEVEKRAAAGQSVAAELTRSRLDLGKARGELLKAVIDWNIAEVKLYRAMGLLMR